MFAGFLVGGWIDHLLGWRMAFIAVGVPGILLAVFVWVTLREPVRGMSEGGRTVAEQQPLGQVTRFLWSRLSFRHLSLATGLHAFVAFGIVNWMPPFLARVHGMESGEISSWLAPIVAGGGATGALLGGWLTDKYGARDARWYVWIPGGAILLSVPLQLFVFFEPNHVTALLVYTVPVLLGATFMGPTLATIHAMVSARMRAVASAILLFVLNLIGLGLGPLFTGVTSDVLGQPWGFDLGVGEGLRWSLVIVALVNVWCVVHYFLAARSLRQDLANAPK